MSFIPAHRVIEGASPRRTAYVLHGALGSGQNFNRFTQKLARERPDYRYVLVDLRNHGRSSGAPPPHTLASCADDLRALAEHLGGAPEVIVGHSFGGKVALEYARQHPEALEQVWVLDAVPGSQGAGLDSEVSGVIRAVRNTPVPAASRQAVVADLVERARLSPGTAQWMATNLKRDAARGTGHYEWAFDLDGIEELMADYFRVDLWNYLSSPRSAPEVELVVAERSDRWTPEMRERARALSPEARVTLHDLPDSGHWVHVDNPGALLSMMSGKMVG